MPTRCHQVHCISVRTIGTAVMVPVEDITLPQALQACLQRHLRSRYQQRKHCQPGTCCP